MTKSPKEAVLILVYCSRILKVNRNY